MLKFFDKNNSFKMKKTFISSLLFIFLNLSLFGQTKEEIINNMINEVTYLASDKLEGRATGTKSEKLAAKYISEKFKKYNLQSKGEDGFLQYFDAKIKENPHSQKIKKKITGMNVVGYLDNKQKETIIIGAHYDHVGYGSFGSLYDGEKQVHNGADDNASGVAALIQLAKFYNQSAYDAHNYIFIAFSGEEKGLLGSNAYVKKTDQLKGFNCMINLDMIGRLDTASTLQIYGTGTSPSWDDLIDTNNVYGFNIKKSKSGTGPSDHTMFYLQDIPVLHFFTGAHEDYHKPSDDAEKINYQGIIKIVYFIQNIINDLDNTYPLAFTKTKEQNNKNTPRFSVTLGVMPDYLFDGEGMRIDGISPGRPAEEAKMKKGDIVIQLGKNRVTDMTTYMKALGAHSKGERVNVIAIRDGQELIFSVQF